MLPAYAGMIPYSTFYVNGVGGAPRVCGDDPGDFTFKADSRDVLPAYAGMIRETLSPLDEPSSAPRVCGDDPPSLMAPKPLLMCSPRMRG